MRSKLLFLIFLLVVLAGNISIAENKKPEFVYLRTGEVAIFDGYLFTPEAVVQIHTITESEKEQQKLEFNHKLELASIELERIKKLNESEKALHTSLLANTVRLKDDIIKGKEEAIKKLQNKELANKLFITGAFIAGVALTYTTFYLTTGLVR